MTLAEFLVAISLSGAVVTALLFTILSAARESRRSFSDTLLLQQASQFQDSIMRILRSMSANEGVTYGDADANGLYRRIVIAQGPAPDYPRQEIYFDTTTSTLRYTTNRNVDTTGSLLVTLRNTIGVTGVTFYPSMKSDASLDGALVNVYIALNDRGLSGRRASNGTFKTNVSVRSFAVALRNP